MITRNAALVCVFLTTVAAAPGPVKFTPEETAVVAAMMDAAFPDAVQPLLVVNVLAQASTLATPRVRAINPAVRPLDEFELARPVKIISAAAWANAFTSPAEDYGHAAAAVLLTRPAIDGDGATIEYQSLRRTAHGKLIFGWNEGVLVKTEKEGWVVTRIHFFNGPPPPSTEPPLPNAGSMPAPRPPLRPATNGADAPFRVGGDVKAPVVEYRVEPVSTPEAKAARISGIVILEIIVDAAGNVTDARVLKPLPFGLDQAALDAVRQWRFRPGTLNGVPVAVIYNITMNFKNGD